MNKTITIADTVCRITNENDEHQFIDVYIEGESIPKGISEKEIRARIHHGRILLPEWIVRGAIDESTAIETAEAVIGLLRQGKTILQHDSEGIIKFIDKPPLDMIEKALEDFEKGKE